MQIEIAFTILLGTTQAKAAAVFALLRSAPTQADAVARLAGMTINREGTAMSQLKTLLASYREQSGRRNLIIHNPFGWDTNTDPPTMYKMLRDHGKPVPFKTEPISVAEIDAFISDADALLTYGVSTVVELLRELQPTHLQSLERLHGLTPQAESDSLPSPKPSEVP